MGTAKPFDFHIFDTSAEDYNVEKLIESVEASIDPDLVDAINRLIASKHSSVAAGTLAALLAVITTLVCKRAPESVACTVHEGLVRFSHSYLHTVLRVKFDNGTYGGPLDMVAHDDDPEPSPSLH